MSTTLLTAAALLALISAAHSILGERYILIRLFRRGNLPKLLGGDWFTRRTLRFAWHLTSVAYLGFAALLVVMARDRTAAHSGVLAVIAVTFFVTALVAAVASRGRHLAWPVFLAIAILAWLGA